MSRKVWTLLRKRRILSAPCRRGSHMLRLYKATGKRRPSSLRPGGRGLKTAWRRSQLPRRRWWQGGDGYLLNLFLFFLFYFFLSSLPLEYCFYLSDTTVSLLVRLTPFFLFWRGLMDSRFNYNIFLAGWAFRETCLALKWIGHVPSLFFVAQSDLRSR